MTVISKIILLSHCSLLLSLTFMQTAYSSDDLILNQSSNYLNRIKLVNKIGYHNNSQKSPTQQFVWLDMGNGRTLPMPVLIGEQIANNDTLIGSIGADYQFNDKLDIGANVDFIYYENRTDLPSRVSHKYLSDIGVNAQYKLFENHSKLPNINIYGDISLYDNANNLNSKWLSSGLIGINSYIINEPITISGTASYQTRQPRITKMGDTVEFGDSVSLGGTVGFLVNPEISLNTGLSWQLTKPQKQNGQRIDTYRTQTNLSLGLTYAMSAKSNVSANIRTNISGQSGSSFSLGITTNLGKLPPSLSDQYRQPNMTQE